VFRITKDPSSGSLVQYLAKNYKNDSIVSVDMDVVGVNISWIIKSLSLLHGANMKIKQTYSVGSFQGVERPDREGSQRYLLRS